MAYIVFYFRLNCFVFCSRIPHDDKALNDFIKLMDDVNEVAASGLLADFMPIFQYIPIQYKAMKLVQKAIDELFKLVDDIYDDHKKNFDESRCFPFYSKVMSRYLLQLLSHF